MMRSGRLKYFLLLRSLILITFQSEIGRLQACSTLSVPLSIRERVRREDSLQQHLRWELRYHDGDSISCHGRSTDSSENKGAHGKDDVDERSTTVAAALQNATRVFQTRIGDDQCDHEATVVTALRLISRTVRKWCSNQEMWQNG